MIIDCHGHFTTAPKTLHAWRKRQLDAVNDAASAPKKSDLVITDDEIRSVIAGQMAHHLGNEHTSLVWAEVCNDLIYRVCTLFPDNFVGVCQLPQSPGVPPAN